MLRNGKGWNACSVLGTAHLLFCPISLFHHIHVADIFSVSSSKVSHCVASEDTSPFARNSRFLFPLFTLSSLIYQLVSHFFLILEIASEKQTSPNSRTSWNNHVISINTAAAITKSDLLSPSCLSNKHLPSIYCIHFGRCRSHGPCPPGTHRLTRRSVFMQKILISCDKYEMYTVNGISIFGSSSSCISHGVLFM